MKNLLKIFYATALFTLLGAPIFIYSKLVEIKKINPTIEIELPYATANNFTHQIVYDSAQCFLTEEATQALSRVQNSLKKYGYGLKVWDGYRPLSAQKKFWALVPDERYVADPAKGSRHNRGCAVDVTLIRLSDKKELAMPTEFDNFTEKAHRNFENLPEEIKKNVQLLEDEMKKEGFEGLPTEWWHFDFKGWGKHPVLDISISELE